MIRQDWDAYFLSIAQAVATRATCPRLSVGCVLVLDRQILSTGYNGSMRGTPHCTDDGCVIVGGSCVRTIHAEANAIAQAAGNGVATKGATAYVTHRPCLACAKLLTNAGIARVSYAVDYGTPHPLRGPLTEGWAF